jgi:hypothetical protein
VNWTYLTLASFKGQELALLKTIEGIKGFGWVGQIPMTYLDDAFLSLIAAKVNEFTGAKPIAS